MSIIVGVASCVLALIGLGFYSNTAKIDTISDLDVTDTPIFGMKFDVAELLGISLTTPMVDLNSVQDNSELLVADSTSEILTGQGGYDVPVSTLNYLGVNTFSSTPQVWASYMQGVDIYPELTYISYRIREGDMIGVIAERFDLTQDTLISVNNIQQTRLIQINEYIRIPSMAGILYTIKADGETPLSISQKYEVSAKKTAAVNYFDESTALKAGLTIFIPDAELDWVTRQEINGDLFLRPLRSAYYISSPFGWRNSPFTGNRSHHNGMDMAAPQWTPIYGTLSGIVTSAIRNDPVYGNYVIVTHHSGYSTLYGHMIDLNVSKGQSVSTNSILGWVGSTGMSTGNHVHFTILKNGKAVNPADLWR